MGAPEALARRIRNQGIAGSESRRLRQHDEFRCKFGELVALNPIFGVKSRDFIAGSAANSAIDAGENSGELPDALQWAEPQRSASGIDVGSAECLFVIMGGV